MPRRTIGRTAMRRDELIALASPLCHDCADPVQRLEQYWHLDEDGNWRLRCFMVCANKHRVLAVPAN
jgi:hypothetical protein